MLVKHMPFKYEYKIQIPRRHVSQTHTCMFTHTHASIHTHTTNKAYIRFYITF